MTTVLLLRHGETDWNVQRRIQGWEPVSLNETGWAQATAAGRYVATEYGVDRLITSDLRRTRETADAVVDAGVDAPVEPRSAWRERSFGVYQGEPYEALDDMGGLASTTAPDGGEALADVAVRVTTGWERLLTELAPDETALVVTHGGPISLILGHVRGQSPLTALRATRQANGALTELVHRPGVSEIQIRVENATEFLPDD